MRFFDTLAPDRASPRATTQQASSMNVSDAAQSKADCCESPEIPKKPIQRVDGVVNVEIKHKEQTH